MIVGSYATAPTATPWEKERERRYYEGLNEIPQMRGIEVQLYETGLMHPHDEAFFLQQIKAEWDCVLTCVGGTVVQQGEDPKFGLASDDEDGRKRAISFAKQALLAVNRLNEARAGRVVAVEIHSAPNQGAAKAVGNSSSASSFAKSLTEMASWDWHGAKLVVEHCDAFMEAYEPSKGFLSLDQEIEAINAANQSVQTHVGICINWARSVIEMRDTATAVEHIQRARAAGLLSGVMFSGCTAVQGPYGPWKDNHMPHQEELGTEYFAQGSLMSEAQIRKCLEAAGVGSLLYVGCKISAAQDDGGADVELRVGLNRDLVGLIDRSTSSPRWARRSRL